MSGELLFSLRTLNFLNVIFKKSNVPLQIINQVLVTLYDSLLTANIVKPTRRVKTALS